MGTVVSIVTAAPVDADVLAAVRADLRWVDATFSAWRPDSDVSRLRLGQVTLDACAPEVSDVLALCAEAHRLTDGRFSATYAGWVDPTGLVKGWAVARVAAVLTAGGSSGHVVNGGGDVLAAGLAADARPWRIGVTDPRASARVLAVFDAVDPGSLAIATSGNAERPGEIIDPFTGRAATDVLTSTVIGSDIVMCDAVATAAVVAGSGAIAWLDALPGYEGIVVMRTGEVARTIAGPVPTGVT